MQRSESLARQLEALDAILLREEARSETRIGMTLLWCTLAIKELRQSVERPNDDQEAQKLTTLSPEEPSCIPPS
jgi:hypothetical protein